MLDNSVLTEALTKYIKKENLILKFKGSQLEPEKAFTEKGLLPALAKRAEQISNLCFGIGLGASFPKEEDSLLGYLVIFHEKANPLIVLLCIFDALIEIRNTSTQNNATNMDDLLYE